VVDELIKALKGRSEPLPIDLEERIIIAATVNRFRAFVSKNNSTQAIDLALRLCNGLLAQADISTRRIASLSVQADLNRLAGLDSQAQYQTREGLKLALRSKRTITEEEAILLLQNMRLLAAGLHQPETFLLWCRQTLVDIHGNGQAARVWRRRLHLTMIPSLISCAKLVESVPLLKSALEDPEFQTDKKYYYAAYDTLNRIFLELARASGNEKIYKKAVLSNMAELKVVDQNQDYRALVTVRLGKLALLKGNLGKAKEYLGAAQALDGPDQSNTKNFKLELDAVSSPSAVNTRTLETPSPAVLRQYILYGYPY